MYGETFEVGIKAMLMAGTYVFQSARAMFNQYSVDPTCLLCGENLLSESRDPIIKTIESVLSGRRGTGYLLRLRVVALILGDTAVEPKKGHRWLFV